MGILQAWNRYAYGGSAENTLQYDWDGAGNVSASTGTADTERLYVGQRFDAAPASTYPPIQSGPATTTPRSPASSPPIPSSPASATRTFRTAPAVFTLHIN